MEGKEKLEEELCTYPPILTAKQVAGILQIGKVKAYELMKSNEIKSFRVGSKNIRTTREAVIEYIRKGVA